MHGLGHSISLVANWSGMSSLEHTFCTQFIQNTLLMEVESDGKPRSFGIRQMGIRNRGHAIHVAVIDHR